MAERQRTRGGGREERRVERKRNGARGAAHLPRERGVDEREPNGIPCLTSVFSVNLIT